MDLPNFKKQQAIDPRAMEDMVCGCGGSTFIKMWQLKFVSGMLSAMGEDKGLEIPMYVCANPGCGLMYPAVMSPREAKKYKKHKDAKRFPWGSFFVSGFSLVQAIIEADKKTKMEVN